MYFRKDKCKKLKNKAGSDVMIMEFNRFSEYTLIISHGNGDNIENVEEWLEIYFLHVVNVNAVIYEYSGFGEDNDRRPTEQDYYDDIETVYHYLTQV